MNLSPQLVEQAKKTAEKQELKFIKIYLDNVDGTKTLHVILDKKGGISLDDITKYTEEFNLYLDSETSLNFPYQLDCSSPGAEKEITDEPIEDYLNEYMEVSYLNKKVVGTLIEANQEDITLKYFIKGRPKKETISKKDITKIELKIKF